MRKFYYVWLTVVFVVALASGGTLARGEGALAAQVAAGGQGPVAFTFHAISTTYTSCTAVAAGDFDGDGWVDVIAANHFMNEGMSEWKNPGGGTTWSKSSVDASFYHATLLYTDDLDHDGDPDIAAISPMGSSTSTGFLRMDSRASTIPSTRAPPPER